jgi:hypothetical protein
MKIILLACENSIYCRFPFQQKWKVRNETNPVKIHYEVDNSLSMFSWEMRPVVYVCMNVLLAITVLFTWY